MRRRWPVPGGVVDLDRQEVQREGVNVSLTPQEAALFAALAEASGRTVTRETLLADVWGFPKAVATRAVDHAMARLRTKVEADPASPVCLLSVRGAGYRYAAPQGADDALVGRDGDLSRLHEAVGRAQCVSVVGPAGVGKTALVSRWAHDAACPVVSMASVGADGAVAAVAACVGVSLGPSAQAPEQLGRALAARDVGTVVLDGVEHVVDAVRALIVAWRRAHPRLSVVVTTHAPLGLPGERVVTLAPLGIEEATALLARRLAAHRAGPVPDTATLAALAAQVDGLPLAVELLAARAQIVGPAGWADLARDPVSLRLPGGRASLDDAIARTWRWLDPPLRRVLSCAALYRMMPTPQDLAAVLGGDVAEVQDALDALAVRALWRAPRGPSAAVRAVAAREASDALVVRHARHLMRPGADPEDRIAAAARVHAIDPALAIDLTVAALRASLTDGPLRPVDAERVVAWADSAGHRAAEARVIRGAVRTVCGDLPGATHDLEVACLDEGAAPEARARLGWLLALHGRFEESQHALDAALAGARTHEDARCEAMIHTRWGGVRHFAGDPSGALAHLQAAVGLYEGLGDVVEARRARSSAALMRLELGQPVRAMETLVDVVAVERADGNGAAVAQHLLNLGGAALDAGDLPAARGWLDEAAREASALGDVALAAQARMSSAVADLLDDRPLDALRRLHGARAQLAAVRRPVLLRLTWAWTAVAAHRCGDAAEARRAVDAARDPSVGVPAVVAEVVDVCEAAVHGVVVPMREGAPSVVRAALRVAARASG